MAEQMLPHPVPMTMRSIMATGEAMRQRFRIAPCAVCGGPEVFSKLTPRSKCFRCGAARDHELVRPHERKPSWRRCALCDKQRMSGLPNSERFCRRCRALPDSERRKKMRWKAERESGAVNSLQKTSIKPGLS